MGATEAFIVIYGPVWVNNYSPLDYSTTWMGILHSCTVLGVVTGYVTASIIINFFSHYFTWRFAIQIQGFAEIFFALFFWFENDEYIFDNSFLEGWHGGADKGPNHPFPGYPMYREPYPYYTNWYYIFTFIVR